MRLGLLYISVAQSSFESQINSVTVRVQRSVCINLYNIKKKLSDRPLCFVKFMLTLSFWAGKKLMTPLLKNECSLKVFLCYFFFYFFFLNVSLIKSEDCLWLQLCLLVLASLFFFRKLQSKPSYPHQGKNRKESYPPILHCVHLLLLLSEVSFQTHSI